MSALALWFEVPWLLPLAVLLPLFTVWLLRRTDIERRRRLARLGEAEVVGRLLPEMGGLSPTWRPFRLGIAAMLFGIAAAGPRWGAERTIVRSSGIDMVLALDASLSMLAEDEPPSRLERLKQEVRRLRALAGGDRIGVLAFAGRSYVLSPLTIDGGALDLFLENLDPSVVGQAGSSLARTIRQGVDLLALSQSGADRALVVMSDGEAFESIEEIVTEATRAREQGISLVTVGFGTPAGGTIPVQEDGRTTQKRDENGAVVVTRYSPEALSAAAEAAGGVFIPAEATDKASRIRASLSSLRTKARSAVAGESRTPRFQLFLAPAFLLLLLDTLLAERRWRRRGVAAAARPAAAVLLLSVVSSCAPRDTSAGARAYAAKRYAEAAAAFRSEIAAGDSTPATYYNFGTSLLAADSLAQAAEVLARATEAPDSVVRYRAVFNLGLAHLVQGLALEGDSAKPSLDAALAAYKRILLVDPSDEDARWNYELALRKQDESGGGGGGGGGGGEQQQDPDQSQGPAEQPRGGLGQQQAEQLLGSAAREEQQVQQKQQKQNRVQPPPAGKDW